MTILLLGKNGQLATVFRQHLESTGKGYVSLSRNECDVTDREQVLRTVQRLKPEIIINSTGYVLVDKMEDEGREEGRSINVGGVAHIVEAAREAKAKFVHIGTEYVFDGLKTSPYLETDACNPLNAYGKSKLEADMEALAYEKALVLRVSWLYGPGENNFVKKFIAFNSGKTHNKITGDEISVPTHAATLTHAADLLLAREEYGLFHVRDGAPDEGVSRAAYGREIARLMQMPITFEEVGMDFWNLPAKRPAYGVLSTQKLAAATGLEIPMWQDNLEQYVKSLS